MRTVLLVEDDDSFRTSVKKLLLKEGFNVLETRSAEEAVRVLAESAVDLILLDLYLEGMSGMEFLEKTQAAGRPPVILLTAFGDWGIYTDAVNRGAVDCVPKPVKRQELISMIVKAMAQKQCA